MRRRPHYRRLCKASCVLALSACLGFNAGAAENYWTNGSSGNWTDTSSWSLGSIPDASQSVRIVNGGWKAVEIGPATPSQFPGAMTVNDLTISNALGKNVLLLNYTGASVQLRVRNGLEVLAGGELQSQFSALVVENGSLSISNGQFAQTGGWVATTNALLRVENATYYLTNGTLQAGPVELGCFAFGSFVQNGGAVSMTSLTVGNRAPVGGFEESVYDMISGYLYVREILKVGGQSGSGSFIQHSGTNFAAQLLIEPPLGGPPASYQLSGGMLSAVDAVLSGAGNSARLFHSDGEAFITNALVLKGGTAHGTRTHQAEYILSGGTLATRSIQFDGSSGFSVFTQSNGITRVAENLHLGGNYIGELNLYGGTFSCSNVTWSGTAASIKQTGGALVVSNLFSLGAGFTPFGGTPVYDFSGGTLTCGNMELYTRWRIHPSGQTRRITNPGYFKMGSTTLTIGNADEQLGRFILATNVPDPLAPLGPATNSIIFLEGDTSRLSFANSSAEAWTPGGSLTIRGWNGSPSGGGIEQLKFGNDASGLTTAQLAAIRFELGSPPVLHPASILPTGEVVPAAGTFVVLATSRLGDNLVLSWPSDWVLQSATKVTGVYEDVLTATSPYTNDTRTDPQRFFRLRASP